MRGATNTILSQKQLPKMVICASGGNHGMGVAVSCARLGIECKVFLPKNTPNHRVEKLQSLGANVELFGEYWDQVKEKERVCE